MVFGLSSELPDIWRSPGNSKRCLDYQEVVRHGEGPATARGAWTISGVPDMWRSNSNSKKCLDYSGVLWNHVTELLKLHNVSKWHKDEAFVVIMAEQTAS